MNLAYKIALFCGLAPLIIAVIILTGWFMTSEEEFLIAGVFNILGGVVLFIIGCCGLIFYEYQSRQQHQQSAWKKLLKPVFIMLANFPAAAACIALIIFMMKVSHVVIVNNSNEVIPVVHLTSELSKRFIPRNIKGVMPRDITKEYFLFKHSGEVNYSFELNGKDYQGNLIGYASSSSGTDVTLTISDNGQVTVDEQRRNRL